MSNHPDSQTLARDALRFREQISTQCRSNVAELLGRTVDPRIGIDYETAATIIQGIPKSLARAEITIWMGEQLELAISGANQFHGTTAASISDQFIVPQMWYFANCGLGGYGERLGLPGDVVSLALLLTPCSATDWMLVHFFVDAKFRMYIRWLPLLAGSKVVHGEAEVIACLTFMRLKLAALNGILLPRPMRRRAIRENQSLPKIRIVQLRERNSHEQNSEDRTYNYNQQMDRERSLAKAPRASQIRRSRGDVRTRLRERARERTASSTAGIRLSGCALAPH